MPTSKIYTLSLHDALPISHHGLMGMGLSTFFGAAISSPDKLFQKISFSKMEQQPIEKTVQGGWVAMLRSEEHTSELQSLTNLVCRLLLEKKKNKSVT